ncbi:MAG TPA: hypothetical protein VK615_16740 [Candidatus Binatia bacterium]|nr:hypothetical protein [Candidatus Binatia bacterium]
MIAKQSNGAHSAVVKMRLIINGMSIPIKQMGPDFVFVESRNDYPPGEATIVLQIDGSQRQWQVRLPDGVSRNSERVPLAVA